MNLAQFAEIFAILAIQLRQTDADEATIRVYFDGLKDIEPELLKAAATRLSQTATWFPKTSEWRDMTATILRERMSAQQNILRQRRRIGQPLCLACEDTQWARDHADRVTPCSCRQERYLEAIGRRPLPALPAHEDNPEPIDVASLVKPLIAKRTM